MTDPLTALLAGLSVLVGVVLLVLVGSFLPDQPRPVTTPKSAIGKHFGPYGCHIELDDGAPPDDCVLNYDAPGDCRYGHTANGRPRRHPHTCPYWKPVLPTGCEGHGTEQGGEAIIYVLDPTRGRA